MPTTFVNTIDDIVILAKRSQCDYAGNDIQTTYATKSELPTATSDLTNDSGFITSSDVPVRDVQVGGSSVVNAQGIAEISIPQTGVLDVEVDGSSVVNSQGVAEITLPTFTQVNSDWDATSGVAQILNKPSIPTATSDLTNDSGYITLSDVPAQVNADWNATSGVSEILNKPTIPSVDQSYNASSTNAQSGVAVAQAIAAIPASSYTAGNGIDITSSVISAKVDGTTVSTNASGELTVIGGGGGGSQVNSDWDATSGVAEILNKPVPKTLTAGTGISITDGVSTITISSNVTAPVQDVTVDGTSVVSNGVATITVDQTYDASSANAQSGVAVAEGISDAVAALPTNLTSAQIQSLKEALGIDETVLWENYTFASNKSSSVVMSEDPFNFSYVRITFEMETTTETWPTVQTQIVDMVALNSCVNKYFTLNGTCVHVNVIYARCSKCYFSGTTINDVDSVQWYNGSSGTMTNPLHIYRIVGINRVANN